jgi:hypothetical protein
MATTIRQSIITALIGILKTITVANGYDNEIGNKVYEWRTADINPADADEFPCLVVDDPDNKFSPDSEALWDNELILQIGLYAGGATTPAILRSMENDVINALKTDLSLGGYVYDLQPDNDTTNIGQNVRVIGEMMITLKARFRTSSWNLCELQDA